MNVMKLYVYGYILVVLCIKYGYMYVLKYWKWGFFKYVIFNNILKIM